MSLFKKRVFWFFCFHITLLLFFLEVMMIQTLRGIEHLPLNPPVGNRTSDVSRLKENGFPFSFLVIGDTQGSRRGVRLIREGLKEGPLSFMVHLGDFAKKPGRLDHLFALSRLSREVGPSFPVFLVPGNHDIDYTSLRIQDKDRRITREAFDSLYGARRIHFALNQCLFILTEIDPQKPEGYLAYLREVLERKEQDVKHIFVFIHTPPRLFKFVEDVFPGEDAFYALMETHHVTACFFGHYHGFWRGERNGVSYLIAGGGGRLKERQSEWGKFHHILKITVDETGFSEQLIAVQGSSSIRDRMEDFLLAYVLPFLYPRIWVLYLVTALFFLGGGISLWFFLKSLRGRKQGLPYRIR